MWIWILLSVPFVTEGQQICPGGATVCPDSSTCCQTLDKSYGCCPLNDAVCCDDHVHCCPASHKCSAGMCVQMSTNSSMAPSMIVNNDVVCPNANITCPEDTTCCKDPNSIQSNCCPVKNAVCCNDGYHCCPSGTTCDLERQKCNGNGFITKLYASHKKYTKFVNSTSIKSMTRLRFGSQILDGVVCPGEGFQCPNGNTCCKLPSGNWGCCPFPNGSCCKDGKHCCSESLHCDTTSQYCSQGPNNVTSKRIQPALEIEVGTICPDQRKTCLDSETCCETDEGYGCCPLPNAGCCSDRVHCCPHDYPVCWLGYCWK